MGFSLLLAFLSQMGDDLDIASANLKLGRPSVVGAALRFGKSVPLGDQHVVDVDLGEE
jgi:hypothetical protein